MKNTFAIPALALCTLAAVPAARPDSAWLAGHEARVEALLAKMTLDEKVGQMTQADASKLKEPGDVARYFLGSVLNGGGEDPPAGNSVEAWTAHYETYQNAALRSRLKIPILYGIDAVHGHSNVLGATIFPHNIGLGCTRNPALVQKVAEVTAAEVRATGIQWTFAPMVSVVRDERWGRTYEGFGESTELSRDMGVAAVRGFQGESPRDPKRVLACAKHFVGDGATIFGTGPLAKKEGSSEKWPIDRGDMRLTEAELRTLLLPPYVAAIEAGVGTVMISYNTWNGVQAHGSRRLMTDILKGDLGFKGFLISDWAAIDAIPGDYRDRRRDLHQRRPGHGDGARQVHRVLHHLEVAGGGGPHPHGAHRRRGAPHPARQGGDGPPGRRGQRHGRSPPARVRRLRRSIARSPATRSASRWCS